MKIAIAAVVLLLALRAESAKLGVVVVVDQMRADYLERDPSFTGGFKRLAQEGAVFTDAHHRHIPTETGPGHAAISTGRAPATHGIVANDWFDRATGSSTYCVADKKYGIGPEHLEGPTLADAFRAAYPNGRVFSISGKDRAAVLLGGKHPNIVLWLDRAKGQFTTSSYYRRPKWLDNFNAELADSALLPTTGGSVSGKVLASPAVDEATARLVVELMRREAVGRGAGPDLLLVSFSATDIVGHRYGTEAPEMVAQLRALDGILEGLLRKWKDASGGSLALALTADHGAIPAPEDPSGKSMGVQRLDWDAFDQGLERALENKWSASGGRWILADDVPHIYLNRSLAEKKGLDWADFRRQAAKVIAGQFGVDRVIVSTDIPHLDAADALASVLKRSYRPDRSGDLYVILGENVLLHDKPAGTSHGTPWPYDTHVPLVFWGNGIKKGHYSIPASPMDIAPTMGRLLGVRYAPADGGALRDEVR
jgi:predicted AlkP superfamily pyrophosphatase or phosphodiesterase